MKIKKINYHIFLLLSIFSTKNLMPSITNLDNIRRDISFSFDDISNEELEEFRQIPSCLPLQDYVDKLLELNAPEALQQDLYRFTYEPNSRRLEMIPSIIDDVFFESGFSRHDFSISANLFYNETRKMFFTKHSPFICSYLIFGNGSFLEKLSLEDFPPADMIPDVITLFNNLKLEERRAGVMFALFKRHKFFSFIFSFPLYYIEHNFFLTERERQAIENSSLFLNFSSSSDRTAAEQFARCHLIKDAAGFGDWRFVFLFDLSQWMKVDLTVGLESIWPTAFAVRRGIIGSNVQAVKCPTFDFKELFNIFFCTENSEQVVDIGVEFLEGALNTLTANVARNDLGFHHFTLTPVFYYVKDMGHDLNFQLQGKFEYSFARHEKRFFLVRVNPQEFNRNYTDPAQADANLTFLSQQLVNTLYPRQVRIKVQPGFTVRITPGFIWDQRLVTVGAGYDFWYRSHEYFKDCGDLNTKFVLERGIKPTAYQSKVYAFIMAHHSHEGTDGWHVSLSGDYTFSSHGIGKDFTAALNLIFDF